MNSDKCKHGIERAWCAECNPRRDKRRPPIKRQRTTVHGSGAITWHPLGHEVVHTGFPVNRHNFDFSNLDETTRLVHIDGHPFLWAIEEILRSAPSLDAIQVIPTKFRYVHPDTKAICEKRGVVIKKGHWRPELVWDEARNNSLHYRDERNFLMNLEGDQRKLWDELILFGTPAARLTARYFCLNGEDFAPQRELVAEFGFPERTGLHVISELVNSILRYLDPEFEPGEGSKRRARVLAYRVNRLREIMKLTEADEARRNQVLALSGKAIPTGLPPRLLDHYEAVILAYIERTALKGGELAGKSNKRAYYVVSLRYGIVDGKYKTLKQVASMMGISRERVRQLEADAFTDMNIVIDSA